MKKKKVLVTGASSDIGKAKAKDLATMGFHVVMACRNKDKAQVVRDAIVASSGTTDISLFQIDLASMASVRNGAEQILHAHPQIDVLINNAGGIFYERMLSVDGYEYTFAVNHLGHLLLTTLLLPALRKAGKARIINVSSIAHMFGHMQFEDLMFEKKYSPAKAYAMAKLANVLFTYELDRRFRGQGITANCLHPGVVNTNFFNSISSWQKKYFRSYLLWGLL